MPLDARQPLLGDTWTDQSTENTGMNRHDVNRDPSTAEGREEMVAGTEARVGRPACQDVQGVWRKMDQGQCPLALVGRGELGQHLELQRW